jgi:hypothetical protein
MHEQEIARHNQQKGTHRYPDKLYRGREDQHRPIHRPRHAYPPIPVQQIEHFEHDRFQKDWIERVAWKFFNASVEGLALEPVVVISLPEAAYRIT